MVGEEEVPIRGGNTGTCTRGSSVFLIWNSFRQELT